MSVTLAMAMLTVPGCVVENPRPKTGLTRSSEVLAQMAKPAAEGQRMTPDAAGSEAKSSGEPRTITINPVPNEPTPPPGVRAPLVKRPDDASTRDTRVRVVVRPVGRIAYDGQTLPVVSPGGRFIASQVGAPAGWAAVLAEPEQGAPGTIAGMPPPATRLAVYHVAPDGSVVEPVSGPENLPGGLVLGRSADDAGFLVESPRPDGTRWIGKVEWVSGKLNWLVDDPAINAFATYGPSGELIYCRRGPGEPTWCLIIRSSELSDQETIVKGGPGEGLVFPLCTFDRSNVYALTVTNGAVGSMQVVAVSLGGTRAKGPIGQIVAQEPLRIDPVLPAAYQAAVAMQTPWPRLVQGDLGLLGDGVCLASARARSAVWFSVSRGVTDLAPDSIGGVPLLAGDAAGMLVATGKELLYHAERQDQRASAGPDGETTWARATPVIASGGVPRATLANGGQILVFEPVNVGAERSMGVLMVCPVSGE